MTIFRSHVLICGGTGCTSSGAAEVIGSFKQELARRKLDGEVLVVPTGCHGMCEMNTLSYPEGTFYCKVTANDVPEIVEEHTKRASVQPHVQGSGDIPACHITRIYLYGKQHRIALANCGYINGEYRRIYRQEGRPSAAITSTFRRR